MEILMVSAMAFLFLYAVWASCAYIRDERRFPNKTIFKDDGKPGWWALVLIEADTDGHSILWHDGPATRYVTHTFTAFAKKCGTKEEAIKLGRQAAKVADYKVFNSRNCGIMHLVTTKIMNEFAWHNVLRSDWVSIARMLERSPNAYLSEVMDDLKKEKGKLK